MTTFSIITPVYRPPAWVLSETIGSVLAQTYDSWEWCLVDDCSGDAEVLTLLRELAATEPRVRLVERAENGGIVEATNDALAMAKGDFVVFLDHDDLIEPNALERVAAAIAASPTDDADYLYSDEDKIDEAGVRYNPFFKPTWSPDRFRCQMYTCHLGVVRRSLLEQVGGVRPAFEGSQDFDLVLRVTEGARRIVHIPEVLYHWRSLQSSAASSGLAKPYAFLAGQRAIAEHLLRTGFPADVLHDDNRPGTYVLAPRLPEEPLVSIIIPTRGTQRLVHGMKLNLVVNTVEAIIERSSYANVEIVCVYDGPTPHATLDDIARVAGDRLKLVPFDRPFNFSEKINVGAVHASADRLLLLNDDIDVIAPDWIEHLLMYGLDPTVGAVGARLRFSDRRIQHAGIVCSGGLPHHAFHGYPGAYGGHFSSVNLPGNCLAVTGACLLVSRDSFEAVGGFSPSFPINFNDVDFCFKLHRSGLRNVYSPGAELFHYESSTRQSVVAQDEIDRLRLRWAPLMESDPYYNPNFLHDSPNFQTQAVLSGYGAER